MNSSELEGRIHAIETLGAVDGPGLRMIIFLQGCPLACRYCHNPDSWPAGGGKSMTVDELTRRAARYKSYFADHGGVTISGGEPLLQVSFTAALSEALRQAGISVALDTSGWVQISCPEIRETIRQLLKTVNLVILDIKSPDSGKFQWLTGRPIEPLARFIELCQEIGTPLWVRQVIVPGWNDQAADIAALRDFLAGWPNLNLQKVQLLPHHTLGEGKWHRLGRAYPFAGTPPPDSESLMNLQKLADDLIHIRAVS